MSVRWFMYSPGYRRSVDGRARSTRTENMPKSPMRASPLVAPPVNRVIASVDAITQAFASRA